MMMKNRWPGLREDERYWKIVQTARVFTAFPALVFVLAVLLNLFNRAGQDGAPTAMAAIGAAFLGSVLNLGLIVVSLRRLRVSLGGPSDYWIPREVDQFVKDILHVRRSRLNH